MSIQKLKRLEDKAFISGEGGYGYDFGPREIRTTLIRSKLGEEQANLKYDELQKVVGDLVKDF